MAMQKKKKSLFAILFLFSVLLLVYILGSYNAVPTSLGTPDAEPDSLPDGTGQGATETGTGSSTSGESSTGTSTGSSTDSEGKTSLDSELEPEGELFVVPEAPLGTLGIMSAFAVALGVFLLKK
jgi:hypothetical protein